MEEKLWDINTKHKQDNKRNQVLECVGRHVIWHVWRACKQYVGVEAASRVRSRVCKCERRRHLSAFECWLSKVIMTIFKIKHI